MSDIKSKVQSLDPNISPRNIQDFIKDTDNIYEALVAISERARRVSQDLKAELHGKLDEFSVVSDTIEEVQENKEQIEISKFYERLPNPVIISTEEFFKDEFTFRYKELPKHIEE